jgi:hypothetical protein
MKTTNLIFYCVLIVNAIYGQVTVNNNDMPIPGDTLYYTQHIGTLPADPTNTGPNFTWDYSALYGNNQRLDSFIAVTSAPLFSVATFNNPLDPLHKATVALKTHAPQIGIGSLSPITFQDFYTFYRNKPTEFAIVGVAATVSINGSTPANLPAKYSNLDILYKFPLIFGNYDSSLSSYKFDLGASGYFSEKRFRKNWVDGYGSLTTPFGTFNTIRVKSFSEIEDTVYFNNFPLKFKRYETVYSWLAPGFHGPLLRITYNSLSANNPGTPSAEYFDFNKLLNSIKSVLISNNAKINYVNQQLIISPELVGKHLYLFTSNGQLLKHISITQTEYSFSLSKENEIIYFYVPDSNIKGYFIVQNKN